MNKAGNLRAFATAVQFLTRVPVPGGNQPAGRDVLYRAVVFFPLVGSMIGVITAVIFQAGALVWPVWLAVIVALAIESLITGAFHEDAVADYFDAFGGGWTRTRILEILKDSRIGSFGAVALILGLALRWGGMAAIDSGESFAAIVASTTIGRWVIIIMMSIISPVPHRDGLAKDIGQETNWKYLLAATIFALPGTVYWVFRMPLQAAIAGFMLLAVIIIFRHTVRKNIGGITGDCLGTICYISQIIVLLASALDLGHL
ncbi:MAG: adenosylcobinamide-GDP ribazoletransferase [Candidatus Auribacterota bacterium]|nr:adenosylcobinamide-GDP ribazoletransferase [Candidatus Auribacterota bacterium]